MGSSGFLPSIRLGMIYWYSGGVQKKSAELYCGLQQKKHVLKYPFWLGFTVTENLWGFVGFLAFVLALFEKLLYSTYSECQKFVA